MIRTRKTEISRYTLRKMLKFANKQLYVVELNNVYIPQILFNRFSK